MIQVKILKSKTILNSLSCKAQKGTLAHRGLQDHRENLDAMVSMVSKVFKDHPVKMGYKAQKVTQVLKANLAEMVLTVPLVFKDRQVKTDCKVQKVSLVLQDHQDQKVNQELLDNKGRRCSRP